MMKTILLLLISAVCYAQATFQVCVKKTLAGVQTEQCQTLGPDAVQALQAFVADTPWMLNNKGEKVRSPSQYRGLAHLIFAWLNEKLIALNVEKYPSKGLMQLKAAEAAAAAATKAAQDAALPTVPAQEP